ncbi:predicted protein [Nematostella vectensis]|uniref:Nuclear pore protein n=1 Tax=Nematostella vectensis TaxID=45351 RepID=A7S3U8_NEMVE|nr:nuclear pore complex protein Nup93 [Nematostella vectensis]EDO41551.1 predicted protein [Nematostella vectensis]|eukprot:XP_001633614.1 predicted protein [Nematostella vectensis]
MSNFSDLLQQAEQLTADMDSGWELPRIDRNLHQLAEAGQRLLSRSSTTAGERADVKASILLGSKGFDVPKLSEKLDQLDTTKTFEPIEPVRETDIQGFLRNERENAILSAIEEARKSTFAQSKKYQWSCMESELEQEKEKIFNSLLGAQESVEFLPEPEVFSASSLNMHGRSALDATELAYARQVYIHNEAAVTGMPHNIVDGFLEVADRLEEKSVRDFWPFIKDLGEIGHSRESPHKIRFSPEFQVQFLERARHFLEERYLRYVQETVYDNLQSAQLGGVPGTFPLVKSFLKIKLPHGAQGLEDGDLDGTPIWPLIYYCMRCGDPDSALQAVGYIPQHLSDFKDFFREYINSDRRRINPSTESKVRLQYRRSVRTSQDPFKRAVYCLVGHCDLADNHQELATKTEDYLWLKLSLVSVDQSDAQDEMTLDQLQILLLEQFGETHFGAYQQPFLYFMVLFLTGQFEAAVEFLSRVEFFRSHAVHIAISLYEMGLLAVSESLQTQLLTTDPSTPQPFRQLNFARLIMSYTRKFEMTDPREALQYFYLLRNIKRPHGGDLFMECVSELVLETREFEMLLGKLEPNGTRKPGCIDKFQRDRQDTQAIIERVAKDTEEKGLFEEAIRLYDLAKNHDKTIELMNKLISQVVSTCGAPQSPRDRLHNMAVEIADRYRAQGHNASQSRMSTFFLLLDLMQFFDLYHGNQTDTALDVIQKLKLVPLSSETVEERVAAFRQYNDEIRRVLPDVLLATMNILYTKYRGTKSSGQSPLLDRRRDDGGMEQLRMILRRQARSLLTFAGLIPYRMPGDTNARLVQMEVLMN